MISNRAMQDSMNPLNIFRKFKYDIDFYRKNPTYFRPDGLFIFCGAQGTGKTLSAVNYVYNLMELYPSCMLVTNIDLLDYPVDNERVFRFTSALDLMKYNNGNEGVIFLIDEIQLYLSSHKSGNINMDVMTQISQQRKQRKHIVCTSQVFGRLAKELREQFSSVVLCKCYFGIFQKNSLIDRDSIDGEASTGTNLSGTVVRNYWYTRSPKMFKRYDTYCVIEGNDLALTKKEQNIYERVRT